MENKEKRTSAITLYCKAKEVDGKKWTNFLTKKGEEWYKGQVCKRLPTTKNSYDFRQCKESLYWLRYEQYI